MDKCAEGKRSLFPPLSREWIWFHERINSRLPSEGARALTLTVFVNANVPELARCQSNLTELSRLLQSLEILQRTQSAPNFTEMQVIKDGQRSGQAATQCSFRKTPQTRRVTSVRQTGRQGWALLQITPLRVRLRVRSISIQFLCFCFASVLADLPYFNSLLAFCFWERLLLLIPCTHCLLPFALFVICLS